MPELHRTPPAQVDPWAPTADEMELIFRALDRDRTHELHGPQPREYAICIACAHGHHEAPGTHDGCDCACHAKPASRIETPRKQTTQLASIIKINADFPPAPTRDFDFSAYLDGCDDLANVVGYGATPEIATAHLVDQFEELDIEIEIPRKQTDLREFYRDPAAFGFSLVMGGVR